MLSYINVQYKYARIAQSAVVVTSSDHSPSLSFSSRILCASRMHKDANVYAVDLELHFSYHTYNQKMRSINNVKNIQKEI